MLAASAICHSAHTLITREASHFVGDSGVGKTAGLLECPINVSRPSLPMTMTNRLRRPLPPNLAIRANPAVRQGTSPGSQTQKPLVVLPRVRASLSLLFLSAGCANAKPPNPQIRGFRRHSAVASSAMTSAIERWLVNAQLSPIATSRAAVAASTCRQAPCAGKPITASRTWAQAPQVLQVASE